MVDGADEVEVRREARDGGLGGGGEKEAVMDGSIAKGSAGTGQESRAGQPRHGEQCKPTAASRQMHLHDHRRRQAIHTKEGSKGGLHAKVVMASSNNGIGRRYSAKPIHKPLSQAVAEEKVAALAMSRHQVAKLRVSTTLPLQFGGKGGVYKGGRAKRHTTGYEAVRLETALVTSSKAGCRRPGIKCGVKGGGGRSGCRGGGEGGELVTCRCQTTKLRRNTGGHGGTRLRAEDCRETCGTGYGHCTS